MTFPWTLEVGDSSIPLHPFFETAAIFIGFRYVLFLRNKNADRIATRNRIYIIAAAMFGAVLGSRVVGGLEDPGAMINAKNILLHFYSNKTILGGLLGGLAGVELVKKIIGEKSASGDLFTIPLILAMIIGRVGCFGMGVFEDTYGNVTGMPTGMNLGDDLLRHPVTLYEIFFLGCVWVLLVQVRQRQQFAEGGMFKLFMIAYLLFRFFLDFIKPHYTWPVGLSTIQIASVLGLVYYSAFIFQPRKLLAIYA